MKWGWLALTTALIALLAVSCGGSNAAEPDKVVGVLLKCTVPARTEFDEAGNYVIPARDYSGDLCKQLLDRGELTRTVGHYNAHYVVTVRTAGSSYTVEVPATTRVRIGQSWPPGSY